MKISIIGAGNVAWHTALALDKAGHQILEVYSRQLEHARQLAANFSKTTFQDHLDFADSEAEIFILSIKDDAINEVVAKLKIPEKALIAHTSGTKSMDVFKERFSKYGVFYPLQTFSKSTSLDYQEIPLCIEGSTSAVEESLVHLGQGISQTVKRINSNTRRVIHVAAVIACNFSNHLWSLADEVLQAQELDLKLLKPLLEETLHKAFLIAPKDAQTGPARRKDLKVIETHLEFLKDKPQTYEIYALLSHSILKKY